MSSYTEDDLEAYPLLRIGKIYSFSIEKIMNYMKSINCMQENDCHWCCRRINKSLFGLNMHNFLTTKVLFPEQSFGLLVDILFKNNDKENVRYHDIRYHFVYGGEEIYTAQYISLCCEEVI